MKNISLENQVVVITGGAGVLAGGIASACLEYGASVSLWGHRMETLQTRADELVKNGADQSKIQLLTVDLNKIEETEKTITYKTNWGVTMRHNKGLDSTPEFLDYTVTDPAAWEDCKRRMYEGENRINWDYLKKAYPQHPKI